MLSLWFYVIKVIAKYELEQGAVFLASSRSLQNEYDRENVTGRERLMNYFADKSRTTPSGPSSLGSILLYDTSAQDLPPRWKLSCLVPHCSQQFQYHRCHPQGQTSQKHHLVTEGQSLWRQHRHAILVLKTSSCLDGPCSWEHW